MGALAQFECNYLSGLGLAQRRAETTVARLIRAAHYAGWLTIIGGCLVILDYALDLDIIRRPLAHTPATHPITALQFIAAGIAVVLMRPVRTPVAALTLMLLVGLVALARLGEHRFESTFLTGLSPFKSILDREAGAGAVVSFGSQTAAMFILVALAFLLRALGRPIASQLIGALGMAPPLMAITGYIYGVDSMHGAMSPTTAVIGLCLSSTPLLLGARTGIMRAISSPWDAARFGRYEIAIIGSVIYLGGFVVDLALGSAGRSVLALFIVLAILVATTTIAYSTIASERNDRKRRAAERAISYLVQHDPLSGLYNRRYLEQQGGPIMALARRLKYPVCVLMIDIDNFKGVNDGFGHLVGDEVIRRVARLLKARLRCSDIAVRYGGEELVGIVLDADLEGALGVANGFRESVASADVSDLGLGAITVSVGVAEVGTSLTEAIARADVALYVAKASGRNRVVADQSLVEREPCAKSSPMPVKRHSPERKRIA